MLWEKRYGVAPESMPESPEVDHEALYEAEGWNALGIALADGDPEELVKYQAWEREHQSELMSIGYREFKREKEGRRDPERERALNQRALDALTDAMVEETPDEAGRIR